jgi:hypothetical protein
MPPELEEKTPAVEEIVSDGIDALLSEEPEEENEQAPVEAVEVEESTEAGEEATEEEAPERADEKPEPLTLDYEVPEGLNERSTERFNKLVEDNKASHEAIEGHQATLTGMRKMVDDSGLTNDEYIGAIDFAAEIKKDPAKGLKRMQSYMEHISKTTGIKIEHKEVDMLEGYPDIQQKVDDMEMDQESAEELVLSRRIQAQQEEGQETQNNETQYNSAKDSAIVEVSNYLAEVSKKDADWEVKAPLIAEVVAGIRDKRHPSEWKIEIEREYDRINRLAKAVRPTERKPTPITGVSHARGGEKEPQTIAEAIDQLL